MENNILFDRWVLKKFLCQITNDTLRSIERKKTRMYRRMGFYNLFVSKKNDYSAFMFILFYNKKKFSYLAIYLPNKYYHAYVLKRRQTQMLLPVLLKSKKRMKKKKTKMIISVFPSI